MRPEEMKIKTADIAYSIRSSTVAVKGVATGIRTGAATTVTLGTFGVAVETQEGRT
jgi:hypothetical protein